jgi:hypothetical protein
MLTSLTTQFFLNPLLNYFSIIITEFSMMQGNTISTTILKRRGIKDPCRKLAVPLSQLRPIGIGRRTRLSVTSLAGWRWQCDRLVA